jgi:hypothetical protein
MDKQDLKHNKIMWEGYDRLERFDRLTKLTIQTIKDGISS